ncbi:uncharacterized protein BX664DRAFT_387742 [Halteromyces radiatus]|uniref:uncharacterized protein n=1 Tax=Halteromyces radiatus TaxID=101107 RepID=UPI0022201F0E|nr:uncharacterized protein BX664DRAFT_387742 [Halteromyces radiatus]KAI8085107.1 hypothetical protein BX664DRAFT_387742 [Halteromyces radiatus]
MDNETCNRIVDSIFKVLVDGSKKDYIGEHISQLEHSLQAASQALNAGADEETILAALLHDIGQFATSADQKQMLCDASALNELDPGAVKGNKQVSVGVTGHERIGAEYLRQLGFSEKVTALVESHVPVKRYLTAKYPEYYASLSGASKLSLKYQGGPYTTEQVEAFEKDPLYHIKVQVRQWDDAAKVVGLKVPDLEYYRPMAVKHLLQQKKQVVA